MKNLLNRICDYMFTKFGAWGAGALAILVALIITLPLVLAGMDHYLGWLVRAFGIGIGTVIGIKISQWLAK